MQKPPVNAEKVKQVKFDGPTDQRTDKAGCTVSCTRLQIKEASCCVSESFIRYLQRW